MRFIYCFLSMKTLTPLHYKTHDKGQEIENVLEIINKVYQEGKAQKFLQRI